MKHFITFILCIFLLAGSLCGCAKHSDTADNTLNDNTATNDADNIQNTLEGTIEPPDTSDSTAIILSDNKITVSGDGAEEENGVVTITDGGTYTITGEISDGRIIVNAPDKEVVLILENADICCSYGSPVYVFKSSLTTIYLADETENSLTDKADYTFNDNFSSAEEEEPNACLYSKSDLIIAGSGQLTVNANYNNGITGKDTLKIETASVIVTAKNHGINGKDCCIIQNAAIKVSSGGDAIRSTNDSDSTLGYITITDSSIDISAVEDGIQAKTNISISGGTYTISAGDDGIHADKNVKTSDGKININESYEGIEGAAIDISGGIINIVSDDDGINAAGGEDQSGLGPRQDSFANLSNYYINISGGIITIDASGDGIDSNGSLTVSGGEVYISTSMNTGNGALDYDGEATITGGIVIAAGSKDMAQNFGNNSTQGSILLTGQSSSAETICIKDSSGNTLASHSPNKSYNCVVISCPSVTTGNTYTVEVGGQTTDVTMNSLIYGNSNGMGGAPFENGNGGGQPMEPDMGNPDGMGNPNGMGNPDGMGGRPDKIKNYD